MEIYRFKPNKRASECTLLQQILKVKEEIREVLFEAREDTIDKKKLLQETWDVIYAAEGILRKYDEVDVVEAYYDVREKAEIRNDII